MHERPTEAPPASPMRLKPDTLAMTTALALMTSLGPLATDMYLPSLPVITATLGASVASVQLTLSSFLIGFAGGQIFYGPLSDRFGRRPPLVAGFLLFVLASLGCAFAHSVEVLMVLRVLQALGASGPIVLARAVVRDLYEGVRAGRELSRMGSIMGVTPAIAPVFGGLLQGAFGWRSVFLAMALFGAALLAFVAAALPETNRQRRRQSVAPAAIARGFGSLLASRPFTVYMALTALAYGGLFSYISASSFILQNIDGLSQIGFGAAFGAGALAFIAGTFLAQRLVAQRGLDGTIGIGVACLAFGALAQLGATLAAPHAWAAIILPQLAYMVGIGLVMPQALAAAMTPFPDRAGAASSLVGLVQMTFAAAVGAGVGHALGASPLPLPLASTVMGCGAFVLFATTKAVRQAGAGRTGARPSR